MILMVSLLLCIYVVFYCMLYIYIYIFICVVDTVYIIWSTLYDLKSETLQSQYIIYILQKLFVIHEGNTKQISTMTVTLHLIKRIDVRKILYKI